MAAAQCFPTPLILPTHPHSFQSTLSLLLWCFIYKRLLTLLLSMPPAMPSSLTGPLKSITQGGGSWKILRSKAGSSLWLYFFFFLKNRIFSVNLHSWILIHRFLFHTNILLKLMEAKLNKYQGLHFCRYECMMLGLHHFAFIWLHTCSMSPF